MNKREGSSQFFAGPLLVGIAIVFSCLAVVGFLLSRHTAEDKKEYRRLMLISNPTLAGQSEQASYTARQKRVGVQKDFTYQSKDTSLKMRLFSKEAELILDQQDEGTQIVEEMRNVTVYMQEELYYVLADGRSAHLQPNGKLLLKGASPDLQTSWISLDDSRIQPMQIVRFLQAEKGAYFYKSDRCRAEDVWIERFVLAGHELDLTKIKTGRLVLKGHADTVEFIMAGDDPKFSAQHFKAEIFINRMDA